MTVYMFGVTPSADKQDFARHIEYAKPGEQIRVIDGWKGSKTFCNTPEGYELGGENPVMAIRVDQLPWQDGTASWKRCAKFAEHVIFENINNNGYDVYKGDTCRWKAIDEMTLQCVILYLAEETQMKDPRLLTPYLDAENAKEIDDIIDSV